MATPCPLSAIANSVCGARLSKAMLARCRPDGRRRRSCGGKRSWHPAEAADGARAGRSRSVPPLPSTSDRWLAASRSTASSGWLAKRDRRAEPRAADSGQGEFRRAPASHACRPSPLPRPASPARRDSARRSDAGNRTCTPSMNCGEAATFSTPVSPRRKQLRTLAQRTRIVQQNAAVAEQLLAFAGQHEAAPTRSKSLRPSSCSRR